ncbi:sensor domain-containing protein [Nocardiopsis sp. NRRL B-16309]|uniref:sensor domain-containing protein n=1 Tax=Nocardiopsis sp. NRRL B-16309 TaxID=1519494 RepID=UPI0006AF6EAF|nr:sensor domain-containing protein [Nocardiopsis sp. NRRL B-16309]KOX15724.1 histidine kinase [Nocardiopsis sp. NRRL B-16309]
MDTTDTPFARLAAETRYVLLGFPVAVVSFAAVLAGLAAGASSVVAVVGLFVLAGTLYVARATSHLDRVRLADVAGGPVERRPYRSPAPHAGALRRALTPLSCPQSWLDALYAVVRFPVSVVAFVLTAAWWAGALGGLLHPVWGWSLYAVPGYTDVGSRVFPESPFLATTLIHMVAGALFTLTAPLVVRACAQAEAGLARAVLLAPEDAGVRVRAAAGPSPEPVQVPPRVPSSV